MFAFINVQANVVQANLLSSQTKSAMLQRQLTVAGPWSSPTCPLPPFPANTVICRAMWFRQTYCLVRPSQPCCPWKSMFLMTMITVSPIHPGKPLSNPYLLHCLLH